MSYFSEKVNDLIEKQGWSEDSLLSLLGDFVTENRLGKKLEEFLSRRAKEENDEAEGA